MQRKSFQLHSDKSKKNLDNQPEQKAKPSMFKAHRTSALEQNRDAKSSLLVPARSSKIGGAVKKRKGAQDQDKPEEGSPWAHIEEVDVEDEARDGTPSDVYSDYSQEAGDASKASFTYHEAVEIARIPSTKKTQSKAKRVDTERSVNDHEPRRDDADPTQVYD